MLLLGACSSGDSSDGSGTTTANSPSASAPETVTETVTAPGQPDTPSPTTGAGSGGSGGGGTDDGSGDSCSGLTGEQAAAQWAGDVPPNAEGYPWATGRVESEGYDNCAALSWMILPIEGGTASSPNQIMLFHNGRYIGTATKEAYGFHPTVERDADDQIQVTWHWPRDGESNAGASGTSVATFTWDVSSESVVMSGEVPPV